MLILSSARSILPTNVRCTSAYSASFSCEMSSCSRNPRTLSPTNCSTFPFAAIGNELTQCRCINRQRIGCNLIPEKDLLEFVRALLTNHRDPLDRLGQTQTQGRSANTGKATPFRFFIQIKKAGKTRLNNSWSRRDSNPQPQRFC